MKKLFSSSALSVLVGVSAIASVILCAMHIQYSRTVRSIQGTQQQLMAVQRNQAMMQQLVSDLVVYGKTNAAIRPLLESVTTKKTVKP